MPSRLLSTSLLIVGMLTLGTANPTATAHPAPNFISELLHGEFSDPDFSGRKPTLRFSYGLSQFGAEEFLEVPMDVGMFDLNIGYTGLQHARNFPQIAIMDYSGLELTRLSRDLGGENLDDGLALDIWRFGYEQRYGMGYDLSADQHLILYTGYSANWSTIENAQQSINRLPDSLFGGSELAVFSEDTHFGTMTESGISIDVLPALALDISYERSVIFRRHLFWKWAGSVGLEMVTGRFIGRFTRSIAAENSDYAPVVDFLLKSLVAYGFYEMRQKEMNWPFGGEAPLATDSFVLGIDFQF